MTTEPTADATAALKARRARLMGPHLPTFHDPPLHLVRGRGCWVEDAAGRRYLDAYNNVPHVGHAHPAVVAAIAAQAGQLNLHARYLHAGLLDYLERLLDRFGHGLSQALLTCTGSEANDVALRMAQTATGKTGVIATDNTYHGNTTATAQLSTRRPPIGGYPAHVRLVPAPDSLQPVGGTAEGQAAAFAGEVARACAALEAAGHGVGALVICPIFANEGLPDVAPGFLDRAAAVVRGAGGLVICDEVQSGFGRLGTHFWGHERAALVPDIVTMGKPMGNGYPVAGLVTRPEIMGAFREAFGYFNTFAATPVSAAAGMAVLDILAAEDLPARAAETGTRLGAGLSGLAHPAIAEIRGEGLFWAVEFTDPDRAAAMVQGLCDRGVLTGRVGRRQQVLKIRPPLPFGPAEADRLVEALGETLKESRDG